MILSSRLVKTLAFSIAAVLHGAAIWGFSDNAPVEIEGSAGAIEASVGNSFADMVAGTISAADALEVIEKTQPDASEQYTPEEVIQPDSADPVAAARPPSETQQALSPNSAPAAEPRTTAQTQAALPSPSPTAPEVTEVIEAETDLAATVTRSRRPKVRTAALEERAKPSKPAAKPRTKRAQPRGNADQNARAGSETGKAQEQSKVAGTAGSRNQSTGNAATSNYPGKVMKKISRVPKPRVGSRGTSVIDFTISPNGGLSAVSLARSSGSAKLDQAAMRVIRRAAPFPPPPAGARRRFSIKIKGG